MNPIEFPDGKLLTLAVKRHCAAIMSPSLDWIFFSKEKDRRISTKCRKSEEWSTL